MGRFVGLDDVVVCLDIFMAKVVTVMMLTIRIIRLILFIEDLQIECYTGVTPRSNYLDS